MANDTRTIRVRLSRQDVSDMIDQTEDELRLIFPVIKDFEEIKRFVWDYIKHSSRPGDEEMTKAVSSFFLSQLICLVCRRESTVIIKQFS